MLSKKTLGSFKALIWRYMLTTMHKILWLPPSILFKELQTVAGIIRFLLHHIFKGSNEGFILKRISIKNVQISWRKNRGYILLNQQCSDLFCFCIMPTISFWLLPLWVWEFNICPIWRPFAVCTSWYGASGPNGLPYVRSANPCLGLKTDAGSGTARTTFSGGTKAFARGSKLTDLWALLLSK